MLKSVVLGGASGTPAGGAIIFGKSLGIVVELNIADAPVGVNVVRIPGGAEERVPVSLQNRQKPCQTGKQEPYPEMIHLAPA